MKSRDYRNASAVARKRESGLFSRARAQTCCFYDVLRQLMALAVTHTDSETLRGARGRVVSSLLGNNPLETGCPERGINYRKATRFVRGIVYAV